MLNEVRERLTYANVIATCALFVALGGGAYALDGRNTVDAGDLRTNAVKAPEIATNAVKGAETAEDSIGTGEVIDASLLEQDFAPGQLPAGPQGPPGEQGVPGQDGEDGQDGQDGQDATSLFAYVRDPGSGTAEASNAVLEYGSGVTGVEEEQGFSGRYQVTFDQSLNSCVVSATPGFGEPQGSNAAAANAVGRVDIRGGATPNQVDLAWFSVNDAVGDTDTSFLIAAFC
jgi:hypothetical protein